MAIDGVKILDSDGAYDIYNYVVDNFKDGKNINKIIADILEDKEKYCTNEFYTEIYWTALAYSLWKIGHLPNEVKDKALEIVQKGANEFWLEIDRKSLSKRQEVLNKLAVQLQNKNPKPIKVPKAKTKSTPYFSKGDVLVVRFEDQYGVVFVSAIDDSPRKIEYHLACTRILQKKKPILNDFLNSQIAYDKQDSSYWLRTDCWFTHEALGLLLDNLEKIGQVKLEDYILGVLSPASTLDDIYNEITRNTEIRQLKLKDTYSLVKELEI